MQWKDALVTTDTTVKEAIRQIDSNSLQIVLVIDGDSRLMGTVTDGDIRRGILKGVALDEPVMLVMNSNPIVARTYELKEDILKMMKQKHLHHIPIIDENGCVIGLETIDNLVEPDVMDNWVILMAGGLGTRLRPLTDECPKPLLPVGGKPLLETIIGNFVSYGFRKFYISVNYMADKLMEYFGDGSQWEIQIKYIHESKRMGTAGSLGLLDELPTKPMIIMNGDLLTKVNFNQLLDFHQEQKILATMCVRDYEFQVPYGVIHVSKNKLVNIQEKPIMHYFVSAGIYVLDPKVLNYIPSDEFYDMPTLFEKLIQMNYEPSVFPIREYWLDIGRMDDFEKANSEFSRVFQ
ncbi:nucleotidyltransferase family protein [Paenibacillus alginolyticus]|uniref:Nucleotidyltransferase family protein n=1 Tax=Paenibacillus alginolyticus TaxID=59839 RepID=A0ABT4G8P5_9BACL|nr:nucleotidyltransferase family protein [Paenibacillus alginolyticus]MCY9692555.1 nucleotidyltransferase family protein [Paenibacillus alginolyticus]MEC0143761.1 nucleotidyltransferase family protein [Paenibacillus alginolyticus]